MERILTREGHRRGIVLHFDLPADDLKRASRFYEGLFGWKFSGVPGMDYFFIEMKDAQGNAGRGRNG